MLKIFTSFLALLSVTFSCRVPLQAQCPEQAEAAAFLSTLRHNHFAPLSEDTDHTARVVQQFIHLADPMHVLYSHDDLLEMMQHADHLLDTTGIGICSFMAFATPKHRSKIEQFHTELQTLTAQKPTFSASDTLRFIRGMHTPRQHANDEARALFFRQMIQLMYLLEASHWGISNDSISQTTDIPAAIASHDPALRDKVKKAMTCKVIPKDHWSFEQLAQKCIMNYVFEAIAIAHDPHTNFFNAEAIQDFISQLQSDEISYGISIGENEWDEKVIASLQPGSEAWRSNQIHVDDKITAIWLGDHLLSGLECMSPEEVENAIQFGDHKHITLELKNPYGSPFRVKLHPEIIASEDNMLTSMVLQNDQATLGYIALPSFYTSSYATVDKGCANDVGKEIMKLKKDSIQGLILDLRFNGGGSVTEAIDLAGLFIDVGPIGLQQAKTSKLAILKEMSRGLVYDGPLIILVNNFSASASELIAGALQDYHRALIIGQTTYGKGTSQQILPVITADELLQQDPEPMGYLKVTTAGLYRITTTTHQCSGIQPDIALPNPLAELKYSEKNEDFPLQLPAISKNMVYSSLKPLPIEELQKRHDLRLGNTPYYKMLLERKSQWPHMEYQLLLHPNELDQSLDQLDHYSVLLDEIETQLTCPFAVYPASSNKQLTSMDTSLATWYEQQKNNALRDAELQECFNIAVDLIQITHN